MFFFSPLLLTELLLRCGVGDGLRIFITVRCFTNPKIERKEIKYKYKQIQFKKQIKPGILTSCCVFLMWQRSSIVFS